MYSWDEIKQSLSKKGFKQEESDHTYLIFVSQGTETKVRTKLSHGSNEPGRDILSKIKRQLGLDSQRDFERLIDCPMKQEEYEKYLKEKKLI